MRFCAVVLTAIGLLSAAPPPAAAQPNDAASDDLWLPAPDFPDVVALWQRGAPADALAVLERRSGAETSLAGRVLKAELLIATGSRAAGVALWDGLAAVPAFETLAIDKIVRAHLGAGDPVAADRYLTARADTSGPALPPLRVEVADAVRQAGDHERARTRYRDVLRNPGSGSVRDRARVGLALTLEAAGRTTEAWSVVTDVLKDFVLADAFQDARALADRLLPRLGRASWEFSPDEYAAIVERLLNTARYDDALAVLSGWAHDHPAAASLVSARTVATLYGARRNDAARSHALEYLQRFPAGEERGEVEILLFRLDVRDGRTDGVRTRGRALGAGRVSGVALDEREELSRLLGAYLVSVGDVTGGLAVYRDLFRRTRSRPMQDDLLWRAGVAAYRAGQLDRAETNLRAVRRRDPGPTTTALATYWLAVTLEARGRETEATDLLTRLAREAPFEYYGMRARDRLLARGTTPPAPASSTFPALVLWPATAALDGLQAAVVLARAGLPREAAAEAATAAARSRDPGLALLAARALHAAGDFARAAGLVDRWFGEYLRQGAAGLPADVWELAYPRAFWDRITEPARREGVDPLLLLAIARRESRYDASARSPVGAVGLFQVMPYTADALAPALGLDLQDSQQLQDPAPAARVAAHLLAGHLAMFGDHLPAVLAAYNAGPERTAAWWAAMRDAPDDLFVDLVPYSETRVYIRRVYANYRLYQRVHAGTIR